MLYPTVIAPLFNKFEPLPDESLKQRVQALMARCGFAAKGLFVMDGSRRSAHSNAYFTGLGAAKRVVFFDTLLTRLTPGEVEAVLAHELGHFKLRHVPKRMLTIFALSLAALALLGWLTQQQWFYTGLGVTPNLVAPNDALALLLFMLALPPVRLPADAAGRARVAPSRVRGRRLRLRAGQRPRPGQRAAQAARRQRRHADARSAVRARSTTRTRRRSERLAALKMEPA